MKVDTSSFNRNRYPDGPIRVMQLSLPKGPIENPTVTRHLYMVTKRGEEAKGSTDHREEKQDKAEEDWERRPRKSMNQVGRAKATVLALIALLAQPTEAMEIKVEIPSFNIGTYVVIAITVLSAVFIAGGLKGIKISIQPFEIKIEKPEANEVIDDISSKRSKEPRDISPPEVRSVATQSQNTYYKGRFKPLPEYAQGAWPEKGSLGN